LGAQSQMQRGIVIEAGPDVGDEHLVPGAVVYFFHGIAIGDYQLVSESDIHAWE
jgi:hypothetical protein